MIARLSGGQGFAEECGCFVVYPMFNGKPMFTWKMALKINK